MENQGSYVALGLKVWKAQIERADKLFGGLSSEDLLREIAPGRNRLLYLWGHLTATHDAMLPLLGLRERVHPEFDVAFISNPDKSQAVIPSHEQVRDLLQETAAMREGHFEFPNGQHSNYYFQMPLAMRYHGNARVLNVALSRLLRREPEVLPVMWQQALRIERLILPSKWRRAAAWRRRYLRAAR